LRGATIIPNGFFRSSPGKRPRAGRIAAARGETAAGATGDFRGLTVAGHPA